MNTATETETFKAEGRRLQAEIAAGTLDADERDDETGRFWGEIADSLAEDGEWPECDWEWLRQP